MTIIIMFNIITAIIIVAVFIITIICVFLFVSGRRTLVIA